MKISKFKFNKKTQHNFHKTYYWAEPLENVRKFRRIIDTTTCIQNKNPFMTIGRNPTIPKHNTSTRLFKHETTKYKNP